MRKLQIDDYKVEVQQNGKYIELPYDVVGSLGILLFHQDLRLNGRELLQNGELLSKIEGAKENNQSFVFLTPEEYSRVKRIVDLRVFGKNEVELVKRILNCEEVEVNITEIK